MNSSQGSAATGLRAGEKFYSVFFYNSSQNTRVKELLKSVVCGHLGDKPTGRKSTGRHTNQATTNWATRDGQLSDSVSIFLSCLLLITHSPLTLNRNKQRVTTYLAHIVTLSAEQQ